MIRDTGKKKGIKIRRKAKIAFLAGIFFALCIFAFDTVSADEFGILSETYVYPDGLQLDTDSKLQVWNGTVTLSDDPSDKREGEISLKGVVTNRNWLGLGIIWDPDDDNQPEPKDMSGYSGGSLNFWVKTTTPLQVGIKDNTFEKWVYLSNYGVTTDNQWRFISIPFSQFSGVNFSYINQFLMVLNVGSAPTGRNFHFDNVKWNTANVGALDHITVSPATWTIPKNLPKGFIARGYDTSGNIVDVYPAWSKSGVTGSFITNQGPISTFIPTLVGSGIITATENTMTDSATVNVADITWNDFFNLIIHEGTYGSIGIYDSDGTATANKMELSTVTYQYPPGYESSIRARYWVTSDGYAGFFVQEGELTDTTSTKNMSGFSDGYINFWVRTPVDLEIGIRSNNIQSGSDMSKAMLSDYNIAADNAWHEVYIALNDFKLWDSRTNFGLMKVFFNIAVVGELASVLSDDFFISNIRYVRRKETTPDISVNIKKRSDNQVEPSGQISFSGVQLGGGWKMANQYLEVTYDTVDPSWGAQIYTDNMGTAASPKYSGDPTRFRFQQPVGLIGEGEPFLTCPMAWMALDGVNPNVPIPVEVTNGLPPSDPDHSVFFESDTNGMWGPVTAESEWLWLKDRGVTKWDDKNGNSELDLTGSFGDPNYELVADFSSIGDEYSTFISPIGISTGWGDVEAGTRQYILNPESPIVIYMASKFQRATVLQRYKTNTITLELFHY